MEKTSRRKKYKFGRKKLKLDNGCSGTFCKKIRKFVLWGRVRVDVRVRVRVTNLISC